MLRYSLFLLVSVVSATAYGQPAFYRLLDRGGQELLNGNIPAARRSLEQALPLLPKDLSPDERAIFYNNLGVVYYQSGEYKKGIDWYKKELAIYQETHNDSLVAGALLNLGQAYKEIGLYKRATEELIRAAVIDERLGNRKELSAAWNTLGNIQRKTGNFSKALVYHERALRLRQAMGYDKGIADSYHNLGSVYLDLRLYGKAERYFLEALQRKQSLENQSNRINTLSSLGRLYVVTKAPDKAYAYLTEAYTMSLAAHNSPKIAETILYLATYYASIGEQTKARGLFQRAAAIARSSSDWPLLADALGGEISLLEQRAAAPELVPLYRELLETKEKAAADMNAKELAKLEIAYDVERKDRALELRRRQARIDQLKRQQLTVWLIVSVVIALTSFAAFHQIRRRKRQVELQKDEITHLHHELSHRTKNYFSLLSGILGEEKKRATDAAVVRALDVNIHRLDAMSLVQQHLLGTSLQSGNKVQLDTYLDHLINNLLASLFPQGDLLQTDRDLDVVFMDYDRAMRVAIVLNELICNAIEHGLRDVENPVLTLSLKRGDTALVLTVRDNGPGMPEELIRPTAVKGKDLVAKLLRTLDGTIVYRNANGCVAEVTIRTTA